MLWKYLINIVKYFVLAEKGCFDNFTVKRRFVEKVSPQGKLSHIVREVESVD